MYRTGARKRVTLIGAAMVLALGTIGSGAVPAVAQPPIDFDPEETRSHFLCYGGKMGGFRSEKSLPKIGISDFLIKEAIKSDTLVPAFVGPGAAFCNPVEKRKGAKVLSEIVSDRQHLKIYRLLNEASDPGTTSIGFENQFETFFTDASFIPVALMVPTRKLPHRFPKGLDHYACHVIEPPDVIVDRQLKLKDQFRTHKKVKIGPPVALCLATTKSHDGKTFPIRQENAHLVCYELDRREIRKTRRIASNQFEKRKAFKAKRLELLCVPSTAFLD